MAMADVIGCVTAVASAFQGGADLVAAIMERRDKKKWRKDKDQELAFQERMLHRALVDAASQCHNTAQDRRQRFGQSFDTGDHIAVSELKDVIIGLQSTVTNSLQLARNDRNAALDLARLHEHVTTQKGNALRSIDELCRRAVRAVPAQRSYTIDCATPVVYYREKQEYASQSAQRSMSADYHNPYQRPAMSTIALCYSGNPGYIHQDLVRTPSSIQHTPISMMARHPSSASTSTYNSWYSQHRRPNSDIASVQESAAMDSQSEGLPALDEVSLHDSAVSGSLVRSRHKPAASISSVAMTGEGRDSSGGGSSREQRGSSEDTASEGRTMSVTSDPSSDCRTASSTPPQYASPYMSAPEEDEEEDDYVDLEARATLAPEVVTKKYESMLAHQARQHTVRMKHPTHYQNIHPAHRQLYIAPEPMGIDPDPVRIWDPLPRPAKINKYHGFCKSAWQIRENVQEGLSIAMIPAGKIGETFPHWKCKMCEFQTKATNDSNALPTQVYHASSGVRYKWIFLAKSHIPTNDAKPKPEAYAYGCIFCAAQGRETAVHANLNALMGHIVGKHKTAMLTPEVLEKTKCILGGTSDRGHEWDINLPENTGKRFAAKIGHRVVNAMTSIV